MLISQRYQYIYLTWFEHYRQYCKFLVSEKRPAWHRKFSFSKKQIRSTEYSIKINVKELAWPPTYADYVITYTCCTEYRSLLINATCQGQDPFLASFPFATVTLSFVCFSVNPHALNAEDEVIKVGLPLSIINLSVFSGRDATSRRPVINFYSRETEDSEIGIAFTLAWQSVWGLRTPQIVGVVTEIWSACLK